MVIFKKIIPHFTILALFIAIAFIYFSPVFSGKKLDMPDIRHWKGMSKEVTDFRQSTGEEAKFSKKTILDFIELVENSMPNIFAIQNQAIEK